MLFVLAVGHRLPWFLARSHLLEHLWLAKAGAQTRKLAHVIARAAHLLWRTLVVVLLAVGRPRGLTTVGFVTLGWVLIHVPMHVGSPAALGFAGLLMEIVARGGLVAVVLTVAARAPLGLAIAAHPRTLLLALQPHQLGCVVERVHDSGRRGYHLPRQRLILLPPVAGLARRVGIGLQQPLIVVLIWRLLSIAT